MSQKLNDYQRGQKRVELFSGHLRDLVKKAEFENDFPGAHAKAKGMAELSLAAFEAQLSGQNSAAAHFAAPTVLASHPTRSAPLTADRKEDPKVAAFDWGPIVAEVNARTAGTASATSSPPVDEFWDACFDQAPQRDAETKSGDAPGWAAAVAETNARQTDTDASDDFWDDAFGRPATQTTATLPPNPFGWDEVIADANAARQAR